MIRVINEDTNGEFAADLMMIAKYFERIGDHAQILLNGLYFPLPASILVRLKMIIV